MIKLPLLLALLATTPLQANAQTELSLSSIESYLRAEASRCQLASGKDVLSTEACKGFFLDSHQKISRAPYQELFRLEAQAKKEGAKDHLPIAKISKGEPLIPLLRVSIPLSSEDSDKHAASTNANEDTGFKWKSAINQYLLVLAVEHGYDLTQDKTRRELKGPFFKDYFRSVAGLGGWSDGGKFFTNYVAHPMEGALYAFLQIQNDPKGKGQEFRNSKKYWISRLKAMGWSALCSTQFEIGPLSQAAIGNVGLHTSHTGPKKRKMAYVDLVVTPTLGTGWVVGEDLIDRYVLSRLDKINNRFLRNTLRVIMNPMRGGANLFRFKEPWHRDN